MTTPSQAPLPSYTATQDPTPGTSGEQPPPEYTFPASFEIGGVQTEGLLVTIPQIKGHLALLHAFADLKDKVEKCTLDIPLMPMDKERRWAWFVSFSAERFDRWVKALTPTVHEAPIEETLPPIDIMMVWHSYMLNPRWYAEDSERMLPCSILRQLGACFAEALDRLPTILESPPSKARVDHFERSLSLPFDPLHCAGVIKHKFVSCPVCRTNVQVPLMTTAGDGYFQALFRADCSNPACTQYPITKETLSARKLAENITRIGDAPDSFLPGTFFSQSPWLCQRENRYIRGRFCGTAYNNTRPKSSPTGVDETMCYTILAAAKFSLPQMRAKLKGLKYVGRLMSAHLEPMMYSVELAGAVLRQGSFVQKMVDFGWTAPGYFDASKDEAALQHAIARYHAFLDLLQSSPAGFFVPTLDIDLVWHTHQLCSAKYASDCLLYVGRFIDHDDKVDGFKLSNAFDLTCRAWKDKFGIDYTHCGCPLPGDTIGDRLSRFLALRRDSAPPSHLDPPNRTDSIIATHASEHNGVQFAPCNERAVRAEVSRRAKHQARIERRAKREEARRTKEGQERDVPYAHSAPFLYPVPMVYAPPGGCVSTQAGVVAHAGACGTGNGQCGGGGAGGSGAAGGGAGGGCASGDGGGDGGGGGGCGGGGGGGGGCGGGCGGG